MADVDKIRLLRLYLESLPDALPQEGPDDAINKLLAFDLDPEWIDSIGEEMSVNRGIENALLADVLHFWLDKYPDAQNLKRYLVNATDSAADVILAHNEQLPILPATLVPVATGKPTKPAKKGIGGKQTTLTGVTVKEKKKKKGDPPPVKKPDTKILIDTSDPAYTSESESEDERTGGRKLLPLLRSISRPCKGTDGKKIVRCLASAGCKMTWAWPRSKSRILKHAMSCAYLAAVDGGAMVKEVIVELAKANPELLETQNERFGLASKRPHNALGPASSVPDETPPLKLPKPHQPRSPFRTRLRNPQTLNIAVLNLGKYRTEGKKVLKQKVNDALVELIVCCGIAPRNIGRAEFKNFVSALNANYNLISRTTFEDSLVPAYAANVRIAVIKSCWFLTISGDGGKLKRKKFVSVNITTIHRQSFCVDLDDVSRISQTGEYFAELFKKIIAKIKELLAFMSLSTYSHDWFDTAREELKISRGLQSVGETRFGTIYWSLDSILRGIPAFISIVRNPKLGIESEVLQKHFADDDDVFKFKRDLTRLGAVLMPLARAIQCLESKDTTPADVYLYWLAVVAQLNDLICRDNKPAPSKKSKYEETLKDLIRQIANYRFSQLIEDERASNVYFTAFVLDPDNRGATILATPNPLQIRPVTVSFSGGQPAVMQHPPLIQRIGLSLQKILHKEYGNEYRPDRTVEEAKSAMRDINPYIAHRVPKDALSALRVQLQGFLHGVQPSDRKKKPTESPREWWVRLLTQDDSDILAALAVKIFSANPVSMPDERGMSTKAPSRPVTVNWRDIKETIHGKPNSGRKPVESEVPDSETSQLTHHDPVEDGLSWLNDGLPDLRTSNVDRFDLAAEFDIDKYLHILADSIKGPDKAYKGVPLNNSPTSSTGGGNSKVAADSVVPKADEWSSWA
ncbi:hypothetical protein C8J57DRAFT_1568538 [Mycena rebaudengoi]|nr:hypothetical protein C8J57DRAFT_1568538 [Mycena rebaudengoi]